MKKSVLIICFSFIILKLFSQDTITYMHYNLLYYGALTSFCTESNNSVLTKNTYLKAIIDYVKPDVFEVNEITTNDYYHDFLLNNVMNTDGRDYYERANRLSSSGSSICNQIFYNSKKLKLISHSYVDGNPRLIDVYKFIYKSQELANYGDTAYFISVSAHLKAGSSSSDEQARAATTNNIMYYLESKGPDNYIISGDFNVYSSSEQAYQNLIAFSNPDVMFYDPINQPGAWNNNSLFAAHHTQSTSSTGDGCKSSGGLDDRFDFILVSEKIKNGTKKIEYIPNSYKVIGNDGLHFNSSINYGSNTSVPPDVLTALAGFSDHLPVTMKLKVEQNPIGINELSKEFVNLKYNNPVYQELILNFQTGNLNGETEFNVELYTITGLKVVSEKLNLGYDHFDYRIDVSNLKNGFYILKICNSNNRYFSKKIIKQ